MSVPYVYDAGALIAGDHDDRRMWAIHHLALEEGRRIIVPAIVVGQAWRDGRRQVRLARFLQTCEVEPTGLETSKAAGVLCGRAGTADVVDATVAILALTYAAVVFTSDPQDIAALAAASGPHPQMVVRKI